MIGESLAVTVISVLQGCLCGRAARDERRYKKREKGKSSGAVTY